MQRSRFEAKVLRQFRSDENLRYLEKQTGIEYDVLADFANNRTIYVDEAGDTSQMNPDRDFWTEVRRLNALAIRGWPAALAGAAESAAADEDTWANRVFTATDLRPPGLEDLNGAGPLSEIAELAGGDRFTGARRDYTQRLAAESLAWGADPNDALLRAYGVSTGGGWRKRRSEASSADTGGSVDPLTLKFREGAPGFQRDAPSVASGRVEARLQADDARHARAQDRGLAAAQARLDAASAAPPSKDVGASFRGQPRARMADLPMLHGHDNRAESGYAEPERALLAMMDPGELVDSGGIPYGQEGPGARGSAVRDAQKWRGPLLDSGVRARASDVPWYQRAAAAVQYRDPHVREGLGSAPQELRQIPGGWNQKYLYAKYGGF